MTFAPLRFAMVVLGAWLFVAPWVLAYDDAQARYNDHWLGLFVAAVAVLGANVRGARVAHALLGVWLLVAPLVLGYRGAPWMNDVIVGAGVLALALTQPFGRPLAPEE